MLPVLAVVALLAALCRSAPADHLITSLPGVMGGMPKFAMYSGYIDVEPVRGRRLFYWFVESQRDPASDPVVLWMNGGPGSSSLLGFLTEHGPFRPGTDGKSLVPYDWAWNKVANVIYVEAPAGVGFSVAEHAEDLNTGDARTASDNYAFILGWLRLYPEFAKNDFYISGESYGGHYVPDLMVEVLRRDTEGAVNLAGMLLGNPATNTDWFKGSADPRGDSWNYITFMWSHGLVPHKAYEDAHAACRWADYLQTCDDTWKSPSKECLMALKVCYKAIPLNDIDIYNVDAPVCLNRRLDYTALWNPLAAMAQQTLAQGSPVPPADPCLDNYAIPYMNQPEVQKALHAIPTKWTGGAARGFNYSADDMHVNQIPLYHEMFRSSRPLRILVYSGDFDGAVPFPGTQMWISCLGRPVKSGWRTWHYDGQVAGGVIDYDRISFATIKGAGHMVPYTLPAQGYAFFERWINNKPL
eukprot:m51a1_g10493 putative serine carboxypeptidase (469) ;mRNA; f:74889-76788